MELSKPFTKSKLIFLIVFMKIFLFHALIAIFSVIEKSTTKNDTP